MYQEFKKYQITLTVPQLEALNLMLMDAPFKVAAPIINSINEQIAAQSATQDQGQAE